MEDKIIFGFDRKIGDDWIPNGYPLSLDKLITDFSEYVNHTGLNPAVYPLGVVPYETMNKQLISEIGGKPFLYYVEQFGAIGKVVGQDEGYENSSFLNNMLETTKEKIRNKQGVVLIVAHTESTIEPSSFIHLHKTLREQNISPERVAYVMGNNWSVGIEYNEWCDENDFHQRLTLINCYEQVHNKGMQLLRSEDNGNTFVSDEEFQDKSKKRKHQLVCLNRRIRPHRYAMIAMLHHNNLLENNLVSFSLETGKDLNCMGVKGRPDIDTMRKICGNRKLMETYMSYYDDLDKISPRTIDFDNLQEVMGIGFESKEPYLDSYFSFCISFFSSTK